MKKRIILLVLLLLNVFFYSCSSTKNTTGDQTEEVVIPTHSNNMNENLKNENEKEEKYEKLKREHFERQTKAVQEEMKRNEKISMENTPVRKKKHCYSLFKSKKKSACVNKADDAMIIDGVSDVRP